MSTRERRQLARGDRRRLRRAIVIFGFLVMVAAAAPGSFASVSSTITIICPPGFAQHCPLAPISISAEGVREYEPQGRFVNKYADQSLLHSGWIEIPATSDLILWAGDDAEIRSIALPGGVFFFDLVQVTADGFDLGGFDNGATIDFESLIGSSAQEIRLGSIDVTYGTSFPLLVDMRSFDIVITSGILSQGNPGHVNALATPEPSGSALLGLGLLVLGARQRRRGRRHSR